MSAWYEEIMEDFLRRHNAESRAMLDKLDRNYHEYLKNEKPLQGGGLLAAIKAPPTDTRENRLNKIWSKMSLDEQSTLISYSLNGIGMSTQHGLTILMGSEQLKRLRDFEDEMLQKYE